MPKQYSRRGFPTQSALTTSCGATLAWQFEEQALQAQQAQPPPAAPPAIASSPFPVGGYVHGGVGDSCDAEGRVELLGEAVAFIRRQGVVAGIAGHDLAVHRACERAALWRDGRGAPLRPPRPLAAIRASRLPPSPSRQGPRRRK